MNLGKSFVILFSFSSSSSISSLPSVNQSTVTPNKLKWPSWPFWILEWDVISFFNALGENLCQCVHLLARWWSPRIADHCITYSGSARSFSSEFQHFIARILSSQDLIVTWGKAKIENARRIIVGESKMFVVRSKYLRTRISARKYQCYYYDKEHDAK